MKKIVFTSVCSVLFFFSCSQDSKLKKIIAEDLFPKFRYLNTWIPIILSYCFFCSIFRSWKKELWNYMWFTTIKRSCRVWARYSNEEIFKANAENESALLANAKNFGARGRKYCLFQCFKGFCRWRFEYGLRENGNYRFPKCLRFYTMVISYKVSEYSKIKKDIKQIPETFKEATEFKAGKTEEE